MELNIPQEVWDKIMHWVNYKDMEVSGFGKVVRDPTTNVFTVVDAYLLKQEGGATHTDIDDASLAKLMYTTREVEGELAWWWHSHVRMPVFWSGTDRETIQDLGKQGWIVASVFNQLNEVHSALCYQTKMKVQVTSEFGEVVEGKQSYTFVDNLKTFITNARPEDERHLAWEKEYDEHVTEKTYASSYTYRESDAAWTVTANGIEFTREEWDKYLKDPKYKSPKEWRDAHPVPAAKGVSLIEPSKPKVPYCSDCLELTAYCRCDSWDRDDYTGAPLTRNDPGLMGYGIDAEAKALGMPSKAYLAVLNSTDTSKHHKNRLLKLEDRLDELVRKGILQ